MKIICRKHNKYFGLFIAFDEFILLLRADLFAAKNYLDIVFIFFGLEIDIRIGKIK